MERDPNVRTRGHNMKIKGTKFRTDAGKFNFPNRVMKIWNSLPQKVVEAPSLNSFKNRVDRNWKTEAMYYDCEEVYNFEHRPVQTNVRRTLESSASEDEFPAAEDDI